MKKCILILLCILSISGIAQESIGSRIATAINNFNTRYPREKVFVHLDNTAYYLNEIIWWKAYLFRTDNDSLGSLSRVLYVELIDPSGQVVQTEKSVVEKGTANGQFLLGRFTQSGFYQVRAYTRYMLNWGTDGVSSRVIPVFKKPAHEGDYSEKAISAQPSFSVDGKNPDAVNGDSSRYFVHFYPEGGQMVTGLKGNVAFEVTDGLGRAVSATGKLIVDNKAVAKVSTLHEGRGVFSYTPGRSRASLQLVLPDGKKKDFELPEADGAGCTMTVDATGPDDITWTVHTSKGITSKGLVTLLIHNGRAREVVSPLARKDMPNGCSQLVLVNSGGDLLCSRMVFNYPHAMGRGLKVTMNDSTIWPDKEMSLQLKTVPDASLSLSVCDAETQLVADTHNAATWYLLSSDLKGYIHNPEYYLEADDELHRKATDLLMLVQGWRKYDVESMDGAKDWEKTYPIEQGLLVDGRLKPYNRRSKVNGANLSIELTSRLGSRLSGNVTTDSTGYYVFTVPDCVGEWNMRMHTTLNDKSKRYYITVNREFSPSVSMPTWYSMNNDASIKPDFTFSLDKGHIDSIPMDLRAHWLKNVEVKARKVWKNPRAFWEREGLGARYASVYYDMVKAADAITDRGEEAPTLIDWLKAHNSLFDGNDNITGEYCAKIAYGNLYGDGPSYGGHGIMWIVNNWFVCGTSLGGLKAKDPTVDKEYATTNYHIPFDISEARSVYISTANDDWKRFIAAPQFEGRHYATIFIYTRSDEPTPKGYRNTTFNAFTIKEDYKQMMSLTGSDMAGFDYRRTLYWNPNVELDGEGKSNLKFKDNSTSRHFTVSAQGFCQDGTPLVNM